MSETTEIEFREDKKYNGLYIESRGEK